MKIGLMRHFEVDCCHELLMNSEEFMQWVKAYDSSPIKAATQAVNVPEWERCYCSDLERAVKTAQHIYGQNITQSPLIREVPITPIFKSGIKLSHAFWLIAGRTAWLFSHPSQPETMSQTKNRVERFVAELIAKADKSVLVVTHGFLMMQIQRELREKGFVGEKFKRAKYGKIYVFENCGF